MQNEKEKWIWAVAAIIVVVGLVLIAFKEAAAPATVGKNATTTGEMATTSVRKPGSQGVQNATEITGGVQLPARTNYVVRYTAGGFQPFVLTVPRGQSVEFVNESNQAMVIHSIEQPIENYYPGFEQGGAPLGRGGKFYFTFTAPGAWAYQNFNGGNAEGVIIVR